MLIINVWLVIFTNLFSLLILMRWKLLEVLHHRLCFHVRCESLNSDKKKSLWNEIDIFGFSKTDGISLHIDKQHKNTHTQNFTLNARKENLM